MRHVKDVKLKIKKMKDEEVMELLIELLKDRVTLNTAFVQDPESGNITHQVVQMSCGNLVSVAGPEPLEVIMRPATAAEQGVTVN